MKYVAYLVFIISFSSATAGSYQDFFKAIELDLPSTVSSLLARGFDPNTLSESGQSGLYLALRDESADVTAVLLAHPDVKVDAANSLGETPLMMAALRGNYDVSVKLIERGAKVRRSGWTPLHYAASGPNEDLVALMLQRGADVDALSPNKNTPLMMAAGYGVEGSVRLLLGRGANKELRNERGETAQDLGRSSGREFIVQMLQ